MAAYRRFGSVDWGVPKVFRVLVVKPAPFSGFAHIGRETAEDGSADMMSVPRVTTISAAQKLLRPVRLMLKPEIGRQVLATGYLDGAWWPYSRDLAAEAPALAKALRVCLGGVERISYSLGAWEPAVRTLHANGALLRLGGYHFQHADTVDVQGRTHRITLLVVPPQATQAAGHQAMALASAAGGTEDPAQLLVASGARPTAYYHP